MSLRSTLRGAASAAALLLMGARHPMHTAVAEITRAADSAVAEISIRIFLDDFGTVVATAGGEVADTAMSRYVRGHFAVADRTGRPIALRWTGARRDGEVVLLALAFPAPSGLAGVRVLSTILSERFPDQINIVRATDAGRSATLLFMPGDPVKVLP